MFKAIGIFCILIGCVGWGNGKAGQERERIRQLKIMRGILGRIRTEIAYGKHTLPEICLMLTEINDTCYQNCFQRIYRAASEDGSGLPALWKKEFAAFLEGQPLEAEEREMFAGLPDRLGFQEETGQAESIGQAEAFFIRRGRQAEESCESKTKMIRSVSILTGLLLTIWLL
ncbi:MAG: stage III sporulation protein AB [Bacteroidales bacterium]|nr:stage III sporulation protein AB [Bacteroidales bacterium]MCM1415479.1 stage III sporulation protein AB [bacterium]MCM1423416.1 stage III sporulation protein AB [bacterium]